MSPSVNSRHTGTIPRTTIRNGSTQREQRETPSQQMPNNLVPHDSRYQSAVTQHTQIRSPKPSNTRVDSAVSGPVDCSSFGATHSLYSDDYQGNWSVRNFIKHETNDHEVTASHNMVLNSEGKSNISKPDRSQVVARLHQIRDYIQQTTTLMDALKVSGDPRQEAQYQKLSGMVEELRDSETKLQTLADKLEHAELRLEHAERRQIGSETGSCASSVRSHTNSLEREARSTSLVRASATAKRNELKLMVEESQRKLQALQEHQAALVALQQKAKEQLQQVKAAQNTGLAAESGLHASDQPQSNTDVLQDVQNLQQRLSVLHEFYDNRNQIAELLGERDEAVTSEHSVLQDKLTELQTKKRHMDHLLAQFSALDSSDYGDDAGSTEENSSNAIDAEVEHVQNRMAELSSLKAQLSQLQNVVASLHRRDSSFVNRDDAEQVESSRENEFTVNLCVRNKPDNISSEGERERARDVHNKAIKLQEARVRLQHLQQLLATVADYQNSGQPVPRPYLDQLAQETASDCGGEDSASESASQADHGRQSFERAVVKEKRTNTQADAQRLQARRRELEQLMQKDQGQLASLNRSEPGGCAGDASTSNATWGNSPQITLEDLDDGRAGFSSDDNLCERSSDAPVVSSCNTRLSCSRKDAMELASNRDAVDMSLDSNNVSAPVHPNSQNIWRKTSAGSNTIPPRAIWTPSSQHCNVGEDVASSTNNDGEAVSANNSNFNSCQRALLLEQQQQLGPNGFYQQLWAASQMQQQQALLTTVSQCCQTLWAQQREIAVLRAAVIALQQECPGSRTATHHTLGEEQLAEPRPDGGLGPSAHSLPNLVVPSVNPPPLPLPVPAPPAPRSPPALNNQVPPGNRANNYWDNFRSYSRQNLLSVSRKTNEVFSDRSQSIHSSVCQPSRTKLSALRADPPDLSTVPCKEKLNTNCVEENDGMHGRLSSTNFVAANVGLHADRQKTKKPLAEQSLDELLYSEFTALLNANENQQEFLLQVFENLKQVNSEQLRRDTLRALQNLLSQQQSSSSMVSNVISSSERHHLQSAANESPFPDNGDVHIKMEVSACGDLFDSEFEDNTEGATALQPRNAAWNNKDASDISMPVGCEARLDWEVQAALVDVVPFLRAHLEDTCTPALLEVVRDLAAHRPGGSLASGGHLEETLLRFQGCRLRDIGEELLTAVAEVLQSELSFSRFADTAQRETEELTEATNNETAGVGFLSGNTQKQADPLGPENYNGDLAEADQSCDTQSGPPDPAVPVDCSNEIELGPANEGRAIAEQVHTNEDLNTEVESQWEADQSLNEIPARVVNSFHGTESSPP